MTGVHCLLVCKYYMIVGNRIAKYSDLTNKRLVIKGKVTKLGKAKPREQNCAANLDTTINACRDHPLANRRPTSELGLLIISSKFNFILLRSKFNYCALPRLPIKAVPITAVTAEYKLLFIAFQV